MDKREGYTHVVHTFQPIFNAESRILVLGSLPSVKSREQNFYYGHPQNRFWKVIAALTDWELPETIEKKTDMLLANRIAIWDVIASCDIIGSSDSTIKNVVVNEFNCILRKAPIEQIYANGGKSYELYRRYAMEQTGRDIIKLPSTSPANAAWGLERLCEAWSVIIK